MKKRFNYLDVTALLSLLIFIVINCVVWITLMGVSVTNIFQSCLIAVFAYLVPIILAHFKIKIAYHILGFIIAAYTFSFFMTIFLNTNPLLGIITKIIITALAVLGIGINIVWYRLLFKHSQNHLQNHYHSTGKE